MIKANTAGEAFLRQEPGVVQEQFVNFARRKMHRQLPLA